MKNKEIIKKNALFLVDGSYLLYRSFFAIKPLHTAQGIPTNALFGFCRTLKKLIETFTPSHLAIVWDSKGGSHRNTMYPSYKAHRPPPPDDLLIQKELIFDFIKTVGIKNIALPGFEADDLIATICNKDLAEQTVLVCADKDLYQLLNNPNVIIADLFKDEIIDPTTFTARYGFPPRKLSFFHALVGDSSDNIPGVKGIGEKGAKELVQQFDSLDDLYNNLPNVEKKRMRTALEQNETDARLSLALFTLVDAPLTETLNNFIFNNEQWLQADGFFRKYEFKSLARSSIEKIDTQENIINLGPNKQHPWRVIIVESTDDLTSLIAALKSAKLISLDTETNGLRSNNVEMEMIGMSFCVEPGQAFYLPFSHSNNGLHNNLDRTSTLLRLKDILENPNVKKVLQNAKFDMHVLWTYGIKLQGVAFDTLIAANLVRKNWQTINLKDLSLRLLNEPMETYSDVVGKKFKHLGQVPIEHAADYGAHDARQTLLIQPILEKMLDEDEIVKIYFHAIDMPFSDLLFRMEAAGIKLDPAVLNEIDNKLTQTINEIEAKLQAAIPQQQLSIGEESSFNFNSPRQIEFLLFDVLKLPPLHKTSKGSRSTDQEVLEKLAHLHFIPGLILKYRELAKLQSTYTQSLVKQIHPRTNRIHTNFSQTLVATGRLSSSEPNLQNIPASSEYGHAIRSAFVAESENLLLSADYSQIELRILAHISNDPALCKAFHENKDIHKQTAAELLGISLDEVTQEKRQIGKQLNFSIMYGLTPFGLSQALNIPLPEAKKYIDGYFKLYAQVKSWMDSTIAAAKETGYVTSLWGRRRYIPELLENNKTIFEAGRRAAINSPIQGSAADLMKVAMLNIDAKLNEKKLSSKILLQIHDEIILETPKNELPLVEEIVRVSMESVVSWRVPLKIALRSGKDWGEITK